MALKAGCCVLAFPFDRVSCFAYHESKKNFGNDCNCSRLSQESGRQRFGQIDVVNVLVGVVFNAFPNPSRCHSLAYCAFAYHEVWLRKQSTGYEVSLHQTTVVVQVGILTGVLVRNCEDEGRILNDMHRITIDQ
ncbi:hypothetical protein T4C_10605 [Trichinella pseudospiralis]|uniref:Uncharacterized protein n=1 Tax=Trichinella pseudospiralis TaxID=6337 RepID=A0A0V1K3X0_TRIPS|nr:hypothetical protein T4C_10605 [Trichinella pseudospiralis]